MTGDERFALVNAKLRRARRHYEDLVAAVAAFVATNPVRVGTKRNGEGRPVYFVGAVAPVPQDIALIAGDCLHNARSTLDHLAWQLVLANQKIPTKQTYFPIADNATKYPSLRIGQAQGMSRGAIAAIDALRPFAGGNDLLWRLHKLDSIDKHRLVLAVGASFHALDVGGIGFRAMAAAFPSLEGQKIEWPRRIPLFLRPADNLYPLEVGDELFIDAVDAEIDPTMQFRFQVVFGEDGVVAGEPIAGTVDSILKEVERIIPTFRTHLGA